MNRALFCVLAVTTAMVAGASAAWAHDDVGVLRVVAADGDGLAYTYEVALIYSGDQEPVADAAVTVVAEDATGTTIGPHNLDPTGDPGRYRTSIEFPRAGDWTVRFTSVTPRATLEHSQPVTDDATTSATEKTPDAVTGPSTTLPPSTINLVEETPDSNEAGTGWIVFAGVIFALAVIGAFIVRGSQRARP